MSAAHHPGMLVVIEGIDGGGKTTLAGMLADFCEELGLAHLRSKEPTDGPFGRRLRASAQSGRLSLEDELALFVEDRREHVQTLIAPALAAQKVVILDRYYFSTAAYQGARGADPSAIYGLHESFAPAPDLLLILDLPAASGLARVRARGDVPNDFEREDALEKARAIFNALGLPFARVIDATETITQVHCAVRAHFASALAGKIASGDFTPENASSVLEKMRDCAVC